MACGGVAKGVERGSPPGEVQRWTRAKISLRHNASSHIWEMQRLMRVWQAKEGNVTAEDHASVMQPVAAGAITNTKPRDKDRKGMMYTCLVQQN